MPPPSLTLACSKAPRRKPGSSLLLALLTLPFPALAQSSNPAASDPGTAKFELPPLTVWSTPFSAKGVADSNGGTLIPRETLQSAPQRTLDNILRDTPGFRLFRRTDSIAAHPTTQGVSLGNVGPNGASRSVMLVDGVPMNDPFGGWIGWNRFLPSTLSSVRIIPGGGVSPWGTASLGGVIAVDSRVLTDAPFAFIEAAAGDRLRHQAGISFASDLGQARTRIFGTVHESDFRGYKVISKDTRGPIDIRAESVQQSFDAGVRHAFSDARDWQLTLRAQGTKEQRGNGTPLANNSGDATDLSIRLTRESDPSEWAAEAILFMQRRQFQSMFTSVASDRQSETPSLEQFAVPSSQFGFIQRLRFPIGDTHQLRTGFEVIQREGFTEERFSYTNTGFIKQRKAGGRQSSGAVFIHETWRPNQKWEVSTGARMDIQRDSSGSIHESKIADGSSTLQRSFADRSQINPQFNLASKWSPAKTLDCFASAHLGVRNPTLNELYRPYRIGNNITIANASLKTEKILGAEWGVQWHPLEKSNVHTRAFANQLTDAVTNLTLMRGPGTFPDWGTIPAGGTGARRENIERASVCGLEVSVEQSLPLGLVLNAGWLFTRSRVEQCTLQSSLEGRSLPQIPVHQGNIRIHGEHKSWNWSTTLRYVGGQFDDDLNQYRLASYLTLDARITKRIGQRMDVFASVENAFNSEIQTRLDASGAVGVGAPRMCTAGFRRSF